MTENSDPKRLYRSRKERVVAGVCGGIAEYFEIDPVVVRMLWVFSFFAFGSGLLFYIIAMVIVPENPHQVVEKGSNQKSKKFHGNNWNFAVGTILLLFGALLLFDQIGLFDRGWFHFHFFPWRLFWPVLLIGLGIYFVASGTTVKDTTSGVKDWVSKNRLYKSRDEKIAFGVCGGLARHFDVDPTIVRLMAVGAFFLSAGFIFILYLVAAVILPYEEEVTHPKEESAENGTT